MRSVAKAVDAGRLAPDIFRLLFEAFPGGIVVVRSDGQIVLVNREIESLFGYRREELCGQPIEVLLHETARNKHARLRDGFLIRPSARRLGKGRDFVGRRKDGSEVSIEVGLSPICFGDEVLILSSIVDIGNRKRLERLQDQLVAMVSHELRTPMTAIAAGLGLLAGGKAGVLPDVAAHLTAIAQENCQRLLRLINDILDIETIKSGRMTLDFQRCDVNLLIEKVIESNRTVADDCRVRVRFDASPHPVFVRADSDRFIQVVTNLLSNAIKFSPPDEEVVVGVERRGGEARISVRDHGAGVPAQFKPRVFEEFAQADAVKKQKSGTGLGLAITRRIVELMHGRIGFDDAAGGGTVFSFVLPADDRLPVCEAECAGADGAGA